MTSAKLFMFGQERDLLWVNTNYYRHIASKGDPTSEIQGGFLNFGFLSQEDDEIFWYNLTKAIEQETDRMEKGEIRFYSKGDKDSHSRIYKFNDAYIVHFCQTFEAYGTENMQTVVTLSPAIQNYGIERDFVKYWQKSYPAPAAPFYYIPEKAKKETKVKTIEVLTVLDSGSANDNSGTGTQEGMLYGKTYEFKVVAFTQETPADKSVINWMYKYHSLSENKWIEKKLPVKGETLKFTLNQKDMCGRFVYIRAYIKDAENEGELKVWKHNRFRWFDSKQLKKEIEDRIANSFLIDQGASSMCGIAVVGFNFAREQGKIYKKFISDVHRMGEAKNSLTGYKLLIDSDEHLLKYKPSDIKYPEESFSTKKMALADFIFLICIKDNLNTVYDYDPDGPNAGGLVEGGTGLTLPNEIASVMKNIANYQDVINDTNLLLTRSRGASIWVRKLQDKLNQGYRIGLLIDSDNFIKNRKSIFTVPTHWVGLININCNDTTELVNVEVYTWGRITVWTVSYDVFKDGYFGYIAGK